MRGRWVALAVCAVGALAGGVQWVLQQREATAPPTPQAYVSVTWEVVKSSPGHRKHVGKEQLACTKCHAAADGGLDRPSAAVCASCHQEQAKIRHALGHPASAVAAGDASAESAPASDALSSCVSCHGFTSAPEQMPTDCIRCHKEPQGALHAVATHATAACTECHDVHKNAIEPKPCTQCHDVSIKHGHQSASVAGQCRVCHEVHASAHFAAENCVSCHAPGGARPVPHSAVFTNGHTCASCHQAHNFDRSKTEACVNCHKDVHPLAGHEAKGCISCHAPHAVRDKIEGGAICTTCHKDIKLMHAGKQAGELGACVGCHVPHPPKPSQGPEACVSCHQDIGGPTHTAHAKALACTSCHAPHAFHLALDQKLCSQCHAEKVTALAKRKEHKDCTSCHQGLPHALAAAPLACGSCHQKIQGKVHEGHAECKNCHEPHQASVQFTTCAQCHQRQVELHPRGHDQCTTCHDQHAGTEKPGVADCSLCHKQKKLSGLHGEPKHLVNGCLQCHAAHGAEKPGERKACLSCHEDRVNHQPEATRCDGCHTFIGARPLGASL
jgi:Cytochrome c3